MDVSLKMSGTWHASPSPLWLYPIKRLDSLEGFVKHNLPVLFWQGLWVGGLGGEINQGGICYNVSFPEGNYHILKKTSEVEVCTWGSQLFWEFLSESCSNAGFFCELSRRMESWAREWLGWPKQLKLGDEVLRSVFFDEKNLKQTRWCHVGRSQLFKLPKGTTNSESFPDMFFFPNHWSEFRINLLIFEPMSLEESFQKEIHGSIPLHAMMPSFSVLHRVEVFQIWCILLGLGFRSGKSKASIMRILSPPRKLGA